jgi:hypothetical protein
MAWMQFVQMGMQMAGGIFDTASDAADARAQKAVGYATANANEERIRRDNAMKLGVQRAAVAQSGFDPSSGSMLTLQGQSAANAELDALTERYKGQLTAWQSDERIQRANDRLNFIADPIFGRLGKASGLVHGGGFVSYYGARSLTKG